MKTLFILITGLALAGLSSAAGEKPRITGPHYIITFLDSQSKPLGKATIYTPPFEKKEAHLSKVPCTFVAIPNDGTGKEVQAFHQLFRMNASGTARIDTSEKAPHVTINFAEGVSDANLVAIINLDGKGPEGTWSYQKFTGSAKGGAVIVIYEK